MKNRLFRFLSIIFTVVFAAALFVRPSSNNDALTLEAEAGATTSYTFVEDIKYHGYIRSQDAYIPQRTITGLDLGKPSDMFIDENDIMYIADQKDKKILVFDTITKTALSTITYADFRTPKGLYLIDDLMYVADSGAERVFVFKKDSLGEFNYFREYSKPTSVLFEGNAFQPAKIAVDSAYNMYIVGDSVYEGIIQLTNDGDFVGFFATNNVVKSLKEKVQELIYDEDILDLIGSTTPPLFTNVFTDKRGLVYSTTSYNIDSYYPLIKKHNTSGDNIIEVTLYDEAPTDIYVGSNNLIYVTSNYGYISVYTEEGYLLFSLAGKSTNDISGVFSSLVSIAVDSQNNMWCLDADKGAIHEFIPTYYTNLIFEALDLYYTRDYKASIAKWDEVLKYNSMSALAHRQIGLNYLYTQDYEDAMYHLKLAGDRKNYSQAFWEVRNIWLQTNLTLVIIIAIILIIGILILRKVHKRNVAIATENGTLKQKWYYKFSHFKFIEDMKFNCSVLKSPYNSFYYVKTNKRGSTLSCIFIVVITFFIFLWSSLGKGFIFQYVDARDVDILALFAGYFGLIFLFVLCNWLVSSIQDGEGNFLAVFRMLAVSLVPLAICMILETLLSYVATTNEQFLMTFINVVGIGLTALLLFLGIQNVHFYSFKKTIISILLTILLMAVIILVILLLIILGTQLFQFIETLIKEAFR